MEDTNPTPNPPILSISLFILLFLSISLSAFLGYQNLQLQKRIENLSVQPSPTPIVDSTTNWKTYTGDNFQLKYPFGWDGLKNDCQKISVTKSDAIQLELNIKEYITQKMGLAGDYALDKITKNIEEKHQIIFANISNKDVVILGPLGEGETNNIYIRGPEGTGYYEILVEYNGPSTYSGKECSGDKTDMYKKILSTFKFIDNDLIESKYKITLPEPMKRIQSTKSIASYGFDDFEYLSISNSKTINLDELIKSGCTTYNSTKFCLGDEKVIDILLGGRPAKSFYIGGGVDNTYYIVQTTQAPDWELRMYVAGGGLEQKFQDILSTFKFVK